MNFRKKVVEEVPEEDTRIWLCENDGCKCWMRDNFALDQEPTCPICNSPMVKGTRMLPVLENSSYDMRSKGK